MLLPCFAWELRLGHFVAPTMGTRAAYPTSIIRPFAGIKRQSWPDAEAPHWLRARRLRGDLLAGIPRMMIVGRCTHCWIQ